MPIPALDTFRTHLGEPGWDDVVVGHDFGFLEPSEVRAWIQALDLAAVPLETDPRPFEAALWAACAQATGRAPRPGSLRWAQAQDRWRLALLREALATEATVPGLARHVERLYEQVGCPEDMLSMFRPSQPWSGLPARLDMAAVLRFLDRSGFRIEPIS